MTNQKEIEEKIIRYQILENNVKTLMKRRDLLINKIAEIETTMSTIEDIEKKTEGEIFLPLGAGVYVLGNLKKTKKMIVELGANVAIGENLEKTKEILGKRKDTLSNGLETIENEIVNLSNEMLRLEPEIRAIIEKSKSSAPDITAG